MGYNTAVLFLNDGLSCLAKDPDAGKKIYDAITETSLGRPVSFGLGNHCNMGYALPSRHADEIQLIAVGGNSMVCLERMYYGLSDMTNPDAVLKRWADERGFRLVKKPVRK